MGDPCELLFFDTFSHEGNEETNLDLVQFPKPVYIHEIRIIPLGARVQADFPGGHRLGATNPSQFQVEFFVNDLSKRNATTFERLGSFEYKQNVEIQFLTKKIPTDGLVLRGWYSAITLAVYGVINKVVREPPSPPPPPPPQTALPNKMKEGIPKSKWKLCTMVASWLDSVNNLEEPPQRPSDFERVPDSIPLVPLEWSASHTTDDRHHHHPQPVYGNDPRASPYHPGGATYPSQRGSGPGWESGPPPSSAASSAATPQQQKPLQLTVQHSQSQQQQTTSQQTKTIQQQAAASRFLSPTADSQERYTPPPPVQRERSDTAPEQERDVVGLAGKQRREREATQPKEHEDPRRRSSGEGVIRVIDPRRPASPPRPPSPPSAPLTPRPRTPDRTPPRTPPPPRSPPHSADEEDLPPRGPRTPKEEEPPEEARTPPAKPPPPKQPPPKLPSAKPPSTKAPSAKTSPTMTAAPISTIQTIQTVCAVPATVIPMEPVGESHLEDDDLFETISPDASPFRDGSDVERELTPVAIGIDEDDDNGFEEISSEEEPYLSDGDNGIGLVDVDYDVGDDSWNYLSTFDPFQCELSPLQHFRDPSLTPYEVEKLRKVAGPRELSKEARKAVESLSAFVDKEHNEKWVEALENAAINLSSEALVELFENKELEASASTLLDWTEEGLSLKAALAQSQPAYKVRHIKAGIRMATVLFLTGEDIVSRLLERNMPCKLLDLFMAPYMSLPLKLQIVRALDAATYGRKGTQGLFTAKMRAPQDASVHVDLPDIAAPLDELYESKKSELMTGYQVLLKLLFLKQSTRATVALTALLKKLHLYDLLCKLRVTVDKIAEGTEVREVKEKDADGVERTTLELDAERAQRSCAQELDRAAVSLGLLCRTYRKARREVAQPLRYLPAQSRFEAPQTPFDPYPALFRMFKENHLLEMMCLLASSPVSSAHTGVTSALREILAELLKTRPGMLFLLSDNEAANCLHRALLQDEPGPVGIEDSVYHQVGVHLVYHLQALQYLDTLLAYHSKGADSLKKDLDETEVVTCLHDLYTVLFSDVGRAAVVDVLAMESNLDALVPFLRITGDVDFDTRLCKSVCAGYATELLLLTVRNSDSIQLLQNYSDTLYELSQQDLTPRLQELASWMEPTRKLPSYSHESVVHLMGCVKRAVDTAASLPSELVTALRILQHLGLPPRDFRLGESDDEEELKYKYVIMQVFANDGLSSFLAILQKISEEFLKPCHGSASLVGQQGAQVVSTVRPIVNLLQFMLGYLISCRGTEFKDVTAVPVLLQTYTLLGMVPSSSPSHAQAQKVQVEIVETLLTYTQPHLSSAETEEALNKSLWTQMISEVLKYTLHAPYTFVTGLTVLSELLPLPLPLQIRESLGPDDLNKVVNSRKLWSAHLHSLSADIQEIVSTLSYATCPTVQQLFRHVCVQLSDLAAPSASVVVRALLDALRACFAEPAQGSPVPPADILRTSTAIAAADDVRSLATKEPVVILPPLAKPCPPSGGALGLLDQLSSLVMHGPFKMALLHAVRSSSKYAELFAYLLNMLELPSEEMSHVQAQEGILSIIQTLCDPEVSLAPVEENLAGLTNSASDITKVNIDDKSDGTQLMKKLVNSMPAKEQLHAICSALIRHIGESSHSYVTVALALRLLVMLLEHDFGFYAVKMALEEENRGLHSLLERLSTSLTRDGAETLSTLSATMELLRSLSAPSSLAAEDEAQGSLLGPLRTLRLGAAHLASLVGWKGSSGSEHPLVSLEKLITDFSGEEEALESLLSSIANQVEFLSKAAGSTDREVVEPVLPAQDGLSAQFAARTVYLLGEIDEERLSPAFWLSAGADDAEQECDQMEVDLASLMQQTLPDFDLKGELEKLILLNEEDSGSTKSPLVNKRKAQLLMGVESLEPTAKKPFIAPMRGRGFTRGGLSHTSRANDPFRSRPPNTSRPPSMHVDDFLALESHQHPLATGVAKRPVKEVIDVRGRGDGIGAGACSSVFDVGRPIQSRGGAGRFFSPPGLYGRREPSRLDGRGDFGSPPFGIGSARSGVSMVGRSGPSWNDGRVVSMGPKPLLGSSNVVSLTAGPSDTQPFGRAGPMEPRSSPRSRGVDPYGLGSMSGGSVLTDRFARGGRGSMMQGHSHWMDPRAKAPDSRGSLFRYW